MKELRPRRDDTLKKSLNRISPSPDCGTFLRNLNLEEETNSPIFIVSLEDVYGNGISHVIIWTSLQLRGKGLTFASHISVGLSGSFTLPAVFDAVKMMEDINFSIQIVRSNDGWVGHWQSGDEKGPGSATYADTSTSFYSSSC